MGTKHWRALKITLLVAGICGAPLYYLWKLNTLDQTTLMADLGSVPEFNFATSDGQASFTDHDTYKRVTVLTFVNSGCISTCLDNAMQELSALKHWTDRHLISKNENDSKPQEINYIVMTRSVLNEPPPPGVKHVLLEPSEEFAVPNGNADAEPLFAMISQEGRFKAVLPVFAADTREKTQRLLSKLTSDNYLLHYLTLQNLMWEKAKDYSRGKIR